MKNTAHGRDAELIIQMPQKHVLIIVIQQPGPITIGDLAAVLLIPHGTEHITHDQKAVYAIHALFWSSQSQVRTKRACACIIAPSMRVAKRCWSDIRQTDLGHLMIIDHGGRLDNAEERCAFLQYCMRQYQGATNAPAWTPRLRHTQLASTRTCGVRSSSMQRILSSLVSLLQVVIAPT